MTDNCFVIVSGANGFIGSFLLNFFALSHPVLGLSRVPRSTNVVTYNHFFANYNLLLPKNVPLYFIHCAAAAHDKIASTKSTFNDIYSVNVGLTVKLALFAKHLSFSHFIFISTIGVHGASSSPGDPFDELSSFNPSNIYAQSKVFAELKLREVFDRSFVPYTIFRPSLVYGKNAPGNFKKLVSAIDCLIPFPFASVSNSRSFCSIYNLSSALSSVLGDDRTFGHSFVVADAECISTPDLIRQIASIRNKPALLFRFPHLFDSMCRHLPLVSRSYIQMTSDLVVDTSKISDLVSWKQPFSLYSGLHTAFSGSFSASLSCR